MTDMDSYDVAFLIYKDCLDEDGVFHAAGATELIDTYVDQQRAKWEAGQWRPIETAPNGYDPVEGCDTNQYPLSVASVSRGFPNGWYNAWGTRVTITHWRPLPAPPESEVQ